MKSSHPTRNGKLLSLPLDEVGDGVPIINSRQFCAACVRRLAKSGVYENGQKNFGYGRVPNARRKTAVTDEESPTDTQTN